MENLLLKSEYSTVRGEFASDDFDADCVAKIIPKYFLSVFATCCWVQQLRRVSGANGRSSSMKGKFNGAWAFTEELPFALVEGATVAHHNTSVLDCR